MRQRLSIPQKRNGSHERGEAQSALDIRPRLDRPQEAGMRTMTHLQMATSALKGKKSWRDIQKLSPSTTHLAVTGGRRSLDPNPDLTFLTSIDETNGDKGRQPGKEPPLNLTQKSVYGGDLGMSSQQSPSSARSSSRRGADRLSQRRSLDVQELLRRQ